MIGSGVVVALARVNALALSEPVKRSRWIYSVASGPGALCEG